MSVQPSGIMKCPDWNFNRWLYFVFCMEWDFLLQNGPCPKKAQCHFCGVGRQESTRRLRCAEQSRKVPRMGGLNGNSPLSPYTHAGQPNEEKASIRPSRLDPNLAGWISATPDRPLLILRAQTPQSQAAVLAGGKSLWLI